MNIFEACENGYLDVVKNLLEKNNNVNIRNKDNNTPLIHACFGGHYEITKLLLDNGALVNVHNNQLITPLIFACFSGTYDLVKLLLEHGANINTQDNIGRTPLMTAVVKNYPKIVELLVEYNADINICEPSININALHLATNKGYVEITKILLQHKNVNPYIKNKRGRDAFDIAKKKKHYHVIDLLNEYIRKNDKSIVITIPKDFNQEIIITL